MCPARATLLPTPQLPLLVPPGVFDDFAWNPSAVLEWRAPADRPFEHNPLDPELPLRLAFVLRAPWDAVPTELARLHTGRGYDLAPDQPALAPYAIDDATDQLHAHRLDAHSVFWLAADNLNALFWGLHDWAHFHNHGPFDERAATELQCDAAALCWLWLGREQIPLERSAWASLRAQVHASHLARCRAHPPGVPLDDALLASDDALISLAESL